MSTIRRKIRRRKNTRRKTRRNTRRRITRKVVKRTKHISKNRRVRKIRGGARRRYETDPASYLADALRQEEIEKETEEKAEEGDVSLDDLSDAENEVSEANPENTDTTNS